MAHPGRSGDDAGGLGQRLRQEHHRVPQRWCDPRTRRPRLPGGRRFVRVVLQRSRRQSGFRRSGGSVRQAVEGMHRHCRPRRKHRPGGTSRRQDRARSPLGDGVVQKGVTDRPVVSTYRLQLRGPASGRPFTFHDAENLLDYLDDLGVSHVYLSPILTAVTGSTHGYDVTDPTTVSAELGGIEGLAALSASAQARGMGLVVDIVPNHVGVHRPEQNAWWSDVLRYGRDSVYAKYFDIDWAPDHGVGA